jgi:hypothetical protein
MYIYCCIDLGALSHVCCVDLGSLNITCITAALIEEYYQFIID